MTPEQRRQVADNAEKNKENRLRFEEFRQNHFIAEMEFSFDGDHYMLYRLGMRHIHSGHMAFWAPADKPQTWTDILGIVKLMQHRKDSFMLVGPYSYPDRSTLEWN